VDAIKHLLSTL